jgi:biopolymer transport protein ExbD
MNFKPTEYIKHLPAIQVIPLIDILLVNLSFFMAMFLYFNFEQQLNISVPEAAASKESSLPLSEEIVVNIMKEGQVVVNHKELGFEELGVLLNKTTELNPGQAVVLRADQKTYHEAVVHVLDICAKSKIWNISFATTKES